MLAKVYKKRKAKRKKESCNCSKNKELGEIRTAKKKFKRLKRIMSDTKDGSQARRRRIGTHSLHFFISGMSACTLQQLGQEWQEMEDVLKALWRLSFTLLLFIHRTTLILPITHYQAITNSPALTTRTYTHPPTAQEPLVYMYIVANALTKDKIEWRLKWKKTTFHFLIFPLHADPLVNLAARCSGSYNRKCRWVVQACPWWRFVQGRNSTGK